MGRREVRTRIGIDLCVLPCVNQLVESCYTAQGAIESPGSLVLCGGPEEGDGEWGGDPRGRRNMGTYS